MKIETLKALVRRNGGRLHQYNLMSNPPQVRFDVEIRLENLVNLIQNLFPDEEIGRLADTVDNLLGCETLPLDENLAKGARCGALTDLRDQLRAMHVRVTGDNPWEGL